MTEPCGPCWRVFAQTAFEVGRLVASGSAYFGLSVTIASEGVSEHGAETRLSVALPRHALAGELVIVARDATGDDYAAALAAEIAGNASGMGALATRCPQVWTLSASPGTGQPLLLIGAALLASVALGPVLPPDGSTLLGVRSARRRFDDLVGAPRLAR